MPGGYRRLARRHLAICVCTAGLLAGCQGPPLPYAPRPPSRPVALRAPISTTRFGRATAALVDREGAARGRGVQVTDAMIERIERAVRLRRRAWEPVPADCGMGKVAREMPPPDINGDASQGGIDPLLFLRGMKKLLEEGRAPYRLR